MATYAELAVIQQDPLWNDLVGKILVATTIKAAAIVDDPTSAGAIHEWSLRAIASPRNTANELAAYVVAVNNTLPIASIYNASDAAIQNNIDEAVDSMYGG